MEVDQQVGFGVGVSACGPGNAELPMQGILSVSESSTSYSNILKLIFYW